MSRVTAWFKVKFKINPEAVATHLETVSMTTGIVSGIAAGVAIYYKPTVTQAICMFLHLCDQPPISTVAIFLGNTVTVAGVLSGAAYF